MQGSRSCGFIRNCGSRNEGRLDSKYSPAFFGDLIPLFCNSLNCVIATNQIRLSGDPSKNKKVMDQE
jgi:hypothetical protein